MYSIVKKLRKTKVNTIINETKMKIYLIMVNNITI